VKRLAKQRRGPGRPKGREYTARLNVPVTPEQRDRYEAAAGEIDVGVSEWVREACDAACVAQERRKKP
jgi:hypothetical protein